jgi:hypothetical protein
MKWAELSAAFKNYDDFLACTLCGGHERRELQVWLDKRTPQMGMQYPCLYFHTERFTGNKTAISQHIGLCMVPNNIYKCSSFRNQFLSVLNPEFHTYVFSKYDMEKREPHMGRSGAAGSIHGSTTSSLQWLCSCVSLPRVRNPGLTVLQQ